MARIFFICVDPECEAEATHVVPKSFPTRWYCAAHWLLSSEHMEALPKNHGDYKHDSRH